MMRPSRPSHPDAPRRRRVGLTLLLAILLPVLPNPSQARASGPGTTALVEGSLQHGGLTRTYLLDLVPPVPGTEPQPLVIVLHGGRGTAQRIADSLGFGEVARREGFVVVYPQAVENNWNDGRGVLKYRSHREEIDDVGFLVALARKLVRQHNLDADRVYVAGPSNGGMMTMRLALEAPSSFAAVAAVIANLPEALLASTRLASSEPQPSVPMLLLNGTEDPMIPYEGGEVTFAGRGGLGRVVSTTETARLFTGLQGCAGRPAITPLPNTALLDGTRVILHRYDNGSPACDLSLYVVRGGGHTWAGTRQRLPRSLVGRTSRDIDATELVWEFFSQRSR